MNTNLLHNILNLSIAVLAALVGFDWTGLVSAPLALQIVSALTVIKLIMNALRDGLTGMVKPQPPVQS